MTLSDMTPEQRTCEHEFSRLWKHCKKCLLTEKEWESVRYSISDRRAPAGLQPSDWEYLHGLPREYVYNPEEYMIQDRKSPSNCDRNGEH